MSRSIPPRLLAVLPVVIFGFIAVLSLLRLVATDSVPWPAVGGVGLGTAVLAGPVTWFVRGRVPEQRLERLLPVAFGVGFLLLVVACGVSLALAVPLFPLLDVLNVGGFIGYLIALIAEQTVGPERRRADG